MRCVQLTKRDIAILVKSYINSPSFQALSQGVCKLCWLPGQPAHEGAQEDRAVFSSPEAENAPSESYSPG